MKKDSVKRFSLRKTTLGLVSAVVGSVFLSFQEKPVLANEQQNHTVNYQYVSEEELTEQEKQLIIKELPQLKEGNESTYYLIYRPNKEKEVLPSTGSASNALVSSAAVLFIVVGIAVGKNAKRKVTSVLLITLLGSSLISPSVLAISSNVLAKYNQSLSLVDNEQLPAPLTIPNYQYVGYIQLNNTQNVLPLPNQEDDGTKENDKYNTYADRVLFDTIYQADDTLAFGQTTVIQDGRTGEKEIEQHIDTNEVIRETVIKEPVSQIIKVGTKATVTKEDIPYTKERIEDNTLLQGVEVVEQEGKKGLKTTTVSYTLNSQTGQVTPSEPIITIDEPINEIIKVGSKVPDIKTNVVIPFDTLYQADDTLMVGQTTTLQDGQNGEKVVVKRSDTNEVISESIVTLPVSKIVKVGTKPTVVKEVIPYNEQRIADDTLEQGKEVVEQEGVNGLKTTTTTYTVNTQTGQVTPNTPTITNVKAIDKIVKVGSKIPDNETTVVIPFDTVYQADDTLMVGQTTTQQDGQNGEKVIVRRGDTNEVIRETVVTLPVSKIVKVGTKALVETEVLPYNEQRINDDTLEQGREIIEQEGVNGLKTTTTTYTLNTQTGQVTPNEPTVTIDKAIDKVIKVGTKLKQKPVVTVQTITKNEDSKSATLTFTLNDQSNAYQSAKVKLYKGNEFIREIAITDINSPVTINTLEYFTPYTLKTEVVYDLGNGVQTEIQQTNDIELEYKKIEIKDITSVELYKKVNDTYQLQDVAQLSSGNLNEHFIKVLSASGKPLWLPIQSVSDDEKDGVSVYKINVTLPELVQDIQGEYKPNTVFYLPKVANTTPTLNQYRVNYENVQQATANRMIAYHNTEKLLPFYNKEYIVKMGNNILPTQKLYQTALRDVVPMIDNQIITDVNTNKTAINRLMLHYADNTVEYVDVAYKEDFKNNRIAEYTISGTSLLYTPEILLDNYDDIVNAVLPTLSEIALDSPTTKQTLNIAETDANKSINDLYLDNTFEMVKMNLATELKKVLSSDSAINIPQGAVKEALISKINTNATAFMLGLTYLNKWYNINYGDINVKDLSAYKLDFFGNQQVSTIDYIIRLGNLGYDGLKASNNVRTFNSAIAPVKNKQSLFDYVESYRQLFLPSKSNNEWLKENSKAYIVETLSTLDEVRQKQESAYGQKNNKYSLGVYDRITSNDWKYQNMLLPLLTMPQESVFVISNMSGLTFGSYERYGNEIQLAEDNFKARLRERINTTAKWHGDYFDIWYRVLEEPFKDQMFTTVLTYDGFSYLNTTGPTTWRTLHDKDKSIQGFFGPVGHYYRDTNLGAYATGRQISYVRDKLLDYLGGQVFTHEMTHNFDGGIYFKGNGRREGLGSEFFAYGLLETPAKTESIMGINMMFNHAADDLTRVHAANPLERYQSMSDIDQYINRMFDVIYTLDYLEANTTLKQSNEVKKKWLRVIENKHIVDKDGNKTHAANKIRRLSDDEVEKLHTLNDLIDNNILNRRAFADEEEVKRNFYYSISLFSPLYAALSNEHGAPGDLMFKRMAFELWAEKGYHAGFLPYVSNQYGQEALNNGSKTWSSWHRRYVGLVSDTLVFDKVFNNEYSSWSDFKKAMYQKRIDKVNLLKPITIRYELGVANSRKEITITSFEQMQSLMDEAMELDKTNIDRTTSHEPASWVNLLKSRIYNAYLRQTNDFRTSIYK